MSALPDVVSTGMIYGRYIVALIDGDDADQEPEAIPVSGNIIFRASIGYIPIQATSEGPVTMMKGPIVGVLDEMGYLCTPHPLTGLPMYRGVKLVATDDTDLGVINWTWQVVYDFDSIKGTVLQIKSHHIAVPVGSEQDLTTLAPVPSSPGYGLPQSESAVLRAEAVVQDMLEKAEAGEFDGGPGPAVQLEIGTVEFEPGSDIDSEVIGTQISTPGTPANLAMVAEVEQLALGAFDTKLDTALLSVTPGTGSLTKGDLVKVGRYGYATREDINMGLVLGGGTLNENVIGGNLANVNTAISNLIDAPILTGTNGNWVFIMNGYDNVINGWAVIVSGFHNKVAEGSNHVTIAGGSIHSVEADVNYPTIGGGTGNVIKTGGSAGTIAGGINHELSGSSATIGGGTGNKSNGFHSTIGGGGSNVITGNGSATISGGESGLASGAGAVIPGGSGNVASGYHSTAAGRGAVAQAGGMRSYGAQFTAPGDAQDSTVIMKREMLNEIAGGLSCDGASGLVIPENTTWVISALVVARRTDVDGENAAFRIEALVKRDVGNTAVSVGTPTSVSIGTDNPWNAYMQVATAGNINIMVVGEAAKTVRFVATLRIAHVSG